MPVKRFEDLIAWQKARVLTAEVYRLTKGDDFRGDPGLVDQMRRAAVSVMSNITGGFDRGTSREFCPFLSIAKGSRAELRFQFYVAVDAAYVTQAEFSASVLGTEEVSTIIGGLQSRIKTSKPWLSLTRMIFTKRPRIRCS